MPKAPTKADLTKSNEALLQQVEEMKGKPAIPNIPRADCNSS